MAREFDLLGDPIPENHGKPGANGHIATAENVNKVRLLVVAKWTAAQIAEELGISVPTLNEHYFKNRSIKHARNQAIAEAKGRVLLQMQQAADDGNVTAQKALQAMIEREELAAIDAKVKKASPTKPAYRRKKDIEQEEAEQVADQKGAGGIGRHLPDYNKGFVQ